MEIEVGIWEQSSRFLDASKTLREVGNIIPACVNAAFAIELMIKSTLSGKERLDDDFPQAIYPKAINGHYLDKLFRKLPQQYQDDISSIYFKTTTKELVPSLEDYNCYFISGRYFYEQGNGVLSTDVIETAIALQSAIESVHMLYAPQSIKASDIAVKNS